MNYIKEVRKKINKELENPKNIGNFDSFFADNLRVFVNTELSLSYGTETTIKITEWNSIDIVVNESKWGSLWDFSLNEYDEEVLEKISDLSDIEEILSFIVKNCY